MTSPPQVVGSVGPATLPQVEAALRRVADRLPVEAGSARSAIGQVLGPVLATRWPAVADRFSVLTNTGLPLELAWTSGDTAVRWTAEVGPPELLEAARAGVAAHLAHDLAGSRIDVDPWVALQRGSRLRYGSWLGLRHRGTSRAAKVYVELPTPRAAALPVPPTGVATLAACERVVDGVVWRMAGLHGDGAVELYARAPRPDDEQLACLASLLPRGRPWLRAVAGLLPVPGLPRPSGFSVTLDPRGATVALTWFCFAKALWRDDAATSGALRARAAGPGSRALHEALAGGAADGRWRHGMVGVGCTATGRTWVQAGLRPA
ncbi:hypothetical protein ASG49_07985 [Marmoricola sp. Leaf446]|uniref:hypothetical protein n=1 Tax=Marmoricola sp. Leaf446 TaxID=1736379 RepID=UPI0006F746CA|nr:hypothetical protein [Marmoricola sp. Leaf446]KQT94749.1 hypothetical protein ASG49_07985 [Marmoricola sp. Leaf446]